MLSRLIFVALLTLSACTPPPDFSRFDEHTDEPPSSADPLTISSNCNDEQMGVILDALDEWWAAVPEVERDVAIVDGSATVRCAWVDAFKASI